LYAIVTLFSFILMIFIIPDRVSAAVEMKRLIYDEAELLSQEEYDKLNRLANEYGAKRETDIVILTSNNVENKDVVLIAEDFYDDHALGYDKAHGNAVILTMDMKNRDIYLAGF